MMFRKHRSGIVCALLAGVVVIAACGKKEEQAKDADRSLVEIARLAGGGTALDDEVAGLRETIEAAGFSAKLYEEFPAQELGKKGRMLAYESKKDGKSGGLIYIKKTGDSVSPSWHWFFEDMAPDSVVPVEINDDGLWDVRVVSRDGKVRKFIQEESFTLMAKDRDDWIALNGASSPPSSDADALWRCFDGDTATAWRTTLASGGEAFIELVTPFGVKDGVLTVQTLGSQQPRRCTVYDGTRKIHEFDLSSKAGRHMIQLPDGVKGSKRVRLVFESAHATDGSVAVAELALR